MTATAAWLLSSPSQPLSLPLTSSSPLHVTVLLLFAVPPSAGLLFQKKIVNSRDSCSNHFFLFLLFCKSLLLIFFSLNLCCGQCACVFVLVFPFSGYCCCFFSLYLFSTYLNEHAYWLRRSNVLRNYQHGWKSFQFVLFLLRLWWTISVKMKWLCFFCQFLGITLFSWSMGEESNYRNVETVK